MADLLAVPTSVQICVLRALLVSGESGDASFVRNIGLPAARSISWVGCCSFSLSDARRRISEWNSADLIGLVGPVIGALSSDSDEGFLGNIRSAFVLANLVSSADAENAPLAKRHSSLSAELGMPGDPRDFAPRQFVELCKRKRLSTEQIENYLESSRGNLFLLSKKGSLKALASALRAWGKYCDLLETQHFPVQPQRVAQWSAFCRDGGSYSQYVTHIKSACELICVPTDWFSDPMVSRAQAGLKKTGLVYKGPRLAVSGAQARSLAVGMQNCIPERLFCLLPWVFLLRASSEAAKLVRAKDESQLTDLYKKPPASGAIGKSGDSIIIKACVAKK